MSQIDSTHLELHEAVGGTAGPINENGLVPIIVIRPGIGRGRGRHLYEADMLEREVNAGRFKGWKMYVDHEDPAAKKARGGLPRSMKDLGGVVTEAWWDPTVPADPENGWGEGAVVGFAKPTRFMRELIESVPEAIGASISAKATGVRPVVKDGEQAWLVEGIQPKGSVDWVTEAGAGGKVRDLRESLEEAMTEDELAVELLETLSDDEIRAHLRGSSMARADLLEALGSTGGDVLPTKREKENTVSNLKELLEAALNDESQREAIDALLAPLVEAQIETYVKDKLVPKVAELIEEAVEADREVAIREAEAAAGRKLEVRDLRDEAHRLIAESKLPAAMQDELKAKYALTESGQASEALNVVDLKEGDTVTKSAIELLTEAVNDDIAAKRAQVAEIKPTRVVNQGDGGGEGGATKTNTGELTEAAFTRAGIDGKVEDVYAGILDLS